MSYFVEERKFYNKVYVYLRKNYRKGKKVLNKRIYLGSPSKALKILNELVTKPLKQEKEITYSGEIILAKISDSVSFETILKKFTGNENASKIVKNITILRTLFPESKRKLFMRRLSNSILKDEIKIGYVKQIYRSMDKIYNNLSPILYEMVKKAVKKYKINLDTLIIDGTKLKVYTNEETGMVKFGYKNNGYPQINLVLAVNDQQIPFFAETYPGNENDVTTFTDFIKHLRHKYRFLTKKIKKKIVVFDQGNVSEKTITAINKFSKNGIFFLSLMNTSIDDMIKKVDKNKMKLIYEKEVTKNKRTKVFGTHFGIREIYDIKSNVVLCYSPNIEKKKLRTLERNIKKIKNLTKEENEKKKETDKKLEEVKSSIKKYNFVRLIEPKNVKGKITLKIIDKELEKRMSRCGFFGLFSNDLELTDEEMIRIYKSKDLVEKGFRELKSDMWIEPFFHRKDYRRKTHAIMVIYGYFFTSLLRCILKKNYSFDELIFTIKSGNAIEGYYESDLLPNKKLKIFRPIKQTDELESIFKKLKIKTPKFKIKKVTATS